MLNQTMSLVSIIIPCFNSEAYIERTIKSALSQTYKAIEIIIVDNNSTDNTFNIVQDYQKKFPEKIKIFVEYKKGAPAARNKGLYEAKGEWLQFLDSDDEILPDKILHQMDLFEGADLIIGNRVKYKILDGKVVKWNDNAEVNNPLLGLIKSKLGNTSANLWRKEMVLKVGGWKEELTSSQEYELMFRMYKINCNIKYCEHNDTIIFVRSDSIARSLNKERTTEILQNKINLRFDLKSYLKENSLLTNQLEKIIDTYIFLKLVKYQKKTPDYVDNMLITNNFKMSVSKKLKHKKIQFKYILKNIFKLNFL